MAQAIKASPTANFVQKTLGAPLAAAATTVTLNNTTSIPNLPGVFIVDRINSSDVETPSAREVVSYTAVSGSTLTGLTRNADASGSDQTHAINAVVEFGPDVLWAKSIYDALTESVVVSTGLLDITKVITHTATQTMTNKTLTSPVINTPTGDVVTLTGTQTLTNKRVTPRVLTAASYTTDTGVSIAGDTQDMFIVTAQAGALLFNAPSGTPVNGQKLIITVASSTTVARALTWNAIYGATTVALPTTTAATTATLSIGFIYSTSKVLWQCVAVS